MKTEKGISEKVLDYVNENTDCISTKEIAKKFNLTTNAAYLILNTLSGKKLITKLDPVNGDNFQCCDWIINRN